MSNQVTINFTPCTPAPVNGYKVLYRPVGSNGNFTEYPQHFFSSPAVLTITGDADGTQYFGYLISDCGTLPNTPTAWGENDPPPAPVMTWQGINGYCETQPVCPSGYTLSADGSTCTKVDTQAPVTSETPIHAAASVNAAYSGFGTRIYNPGFATDGTGTYASVLSTSYWINGGNTTDGPMNRNGIWVDDNNDGVVDALAAGKQLSISFGLTVPVAKIYYMGIAGDNQAMLSVNNVLVVNRNDATSNLNFKYWHIYPVNLNAGYNLVTATGTGDGSVSDSLAMEIYDNTIAQIEAATSDSSLTFLFRTRNLRGGTLQIVECASGYSPIDAGNGSFVCQRVTQTNSTQQNTGTLIYANRERLSNGTADGFSETNTQSGGVGPYIPPLSNSEQCL